MKGKSKVSGLYNENENDFKLIKILYWTIVFNFTNFWNKHFQKSKY